MTGWTIIIIINYHHCHRMDESQCTVRRLTGIHNIVCSVLSGSAGHGSQTRPTDRFINVPILSSLSFERNCYCSSKLYVYGPGSPISALDQTLPLIIHPSPILDGSSFQFITLYYVCVHSLTLFSSYSFPVGLPQQNIPWLLLLSIGMGRPLDTQRMNDSGTYISRME